MNQMSPITAAAPTHTAALRVGQWVEVRSADEIARTLDERGQLDGLPFMPEMAALCGQRLRVVRRADKTCVEGYYGLRRLGDAVFLDGARCDGAAHDGCQRRCLIFWREAWLKPLTDEEARDPAPARKGRRNIRLAAIATRDGDAYACQSTALMDATRSQSKLNVGHLAADVGRGELTPAGLAVMAARTLVNRLRKTVGLNDLGVLAGADGSKTGPRLDLKPGEWVRVKPAADIQATLGPDSKNRGLSFEAEMTRHVGRVFQVDYVLEKIILEESGRMIRLKGTVVLAGLNCTGVMAKNCPRSNPLYWRECWLERVDEAQALAENAQARTAGRSACAARLAACASV
jgi:hypothetical protein